MLGLYSFEKLSYIYTKGDKSSVLYLIASTYTLKTFIISKSWHRMQLAWKRGYRSGTKGKH
jgi:hypothetical protein